MGQWKNCRILKRLLLKGHNRLRLRTQTDPNLLGFSMRAIAGREPVAYGEKSEVQVPGDSLLPGNLQRPGSDIVPCLSPPPPHPEQRATRQ